MYIKKTKAYCSVVMNVRWQSLRVGPEMAANSCYSVVMYDMLVMSW
jgi:hypothetical protein